MSLRDYAELGRISNAPTCVSNVLVGVAIGGAAGVDGWLAALRLAPAILALYVGGMALNDLLDLEVDSRERPGRVLPSGRITVAAAKRFVWVAMTLGLGILAISGFAAFVAGLALVLVIVAYDVLHRRGAWTVVLMGLCRGLVYVVCAAAVAWPLDWSTAAPLAGAITAYILALSLAARVEAERDARPNRLLAAGPALVAALPLIWIRPERPLLVTAAGIVLMIWLAYAATHLLRRPPRIRNAVLAWLAGICLVDAFFLALLDRPFMAAVAALCFALTAWGHRRIAGT